MKYVTLLVLVSVLGACSLKDDVRRLENRVTDVESRLDELSQDLANLDFLANSTVAQLQALESSVATFEPNIQAFINAQIAALQAQLATLESSQEDTVLELAVLQNYVNVSEFVDPCGNNPSRYDELLLRYYVPATQSYVLLASFSDNSSGKNTRLSELPQGTYQTTDGDNCTFTVGPNGTITNQSHNFN